MKRKLVLFFTLFFAGIGILIAQTQVRGTVVDESGDPVIGATIQIKGTSQGTVSDIDGNFNLLASADDRLVISYVGYITQEVVVQPNIRIVLQPDTRMLDEIIISGVASDTPRRKLAISVEKVSESMLQNVPASSAASALQGKVAGVTVVNPTGQPGGASSILVRGGTQIAGSQDPLIIVDGVLMKGTLSDINVDDIEFIEIVKGASASALYGSQAGNGVIVVGTKRGKGLRSDETLVTVRNEYGVNRLANRYDLANHHAYELASDWQNYSSFTKYAGVTYPDGYAGGPGDLSGSRILKTDQYMDNPYSVVRNHQDDFFNGNDFYTNYVSVQGGGEKTNFLGSFENYNQSGIVLENKGYERRSFRLNVDHRLSDRLTLSASNLYVRSQQYFPGDDAANKFNGGSFFNLLLVTPDIDLNMSNPDGQPYLFIPDPWTPTTENPLYNLWKKQETQKRNRFLGSYVVNWNILDELKFTGEYAFENSARVDETYDPYDTYERSGGVAQYSEGEYYKYSNNDFSEKLQFSLSYAKKLGDFNLRARTSFLYENREYESFYARGYDFGVQGIPSFDAIKGNKNASSYQDQIVAKNGFGILYFDYKDKYIFDGMFRYDGSSLFGSEERWQPYYRVSGAWRITEDFEINGIQELKLRSAIGTAGQRPPFEAQYEVMALTGGVAAKSAKGNRFLKPSKTTEYEFGVDIEFLDRFSFTGVYSEATTEDQFLEAPQASYANGWKTQWVNAGTLKGNTFEATLGAQIIRSKDFNWSANLAFDRNRVKITKLNIPPYQTGPEGQEANKAFYIREGESFGVMYGASFLTSLDQLANQIDFMDGTVGDYEVNSDGFVIPKGTAGTITEKPVKLLDAEGNQAFVKIGDSNPDFKLALSSTLSYKKLSLYFLLDWKQGGDVYNKTAQWLTRDNRHAMLDQFGKAQADKKTIPYYQTFYDINDFNDYWVEDGTFVKLRELSLSYNLNAADLHSLTGGFIKGVRFSLIGRNLLTFTNYSGYDPEVGTTDTNGRQIYAYDFMGYPNFRSYSVSLELKF